MTARDPRTSTVQDASPAPAACPFCGSARIAVPSEKAAASTYWRCETCGQMWNVGRLLRSPYPGYRGR